MAEVEVMQREAGYNFWFHNMWQRNLKPNGVLVRAEGDAWIM